MISLPDRKDAFSHENNFYLSCDITRISKILAQYELFKMTLDLPGAIVECGVFKGLSLIRLAAFRELLCNPYAKSIIGFDAFGKFPETGFEADKAKREYFVETSGAEGIGAEQLMQVLKEKSLDRGVQLIAGDITQTVPDYVKAHPELKISFLNLDTDIYEPSKVILDHLYPRVVRGGVVMLDDYGNWAGETKAIDDYFADKDVEIKKFQFSMTPSYVIKKLNAH